MQKHWQIKEKNTKLCKELSKSLDIPLLVAQLLINRDICTVEEAELFLSSDLSRLHDPFQLNDMDIAVKRIQKAKDSKERVLVFGDYDVDGVTSSALLNRVLSQMGIDLIHHIPHRVDDGYGLNHEISEFAKQEGVTLLIAVDCGITACQEVDTLNQSGIDVIVIDHHEPFQNKLPKAYAIINPKQNGCEYPFKDLASVGLVAKLTQALIGDLSDEVLGLAAMGTIADVAPLRGENRILVKSGLPLITETENKGLNALLEVTKIKDKKISPFHVGFILGPRINAAGRMDTAHTSLDLFLCEDSEEAHDLAKELERHNSKRQRMQSDVVQEAIAIIEQEVNFKDQKVIVLSKEGWHQGVLGIVASKVTDRYYRPSIIISMNEGVGTASARSIDGFHIHDALADCADCLENFGGHEGAAGLTIKEENIDPFRSLINDVAEKNLAIKKLVPKLLIDCEIPLKSVNIRLAETVESMEPFGEGNPAPVFCSQGLIVKGRPQVLGRETLKFWVAEGHFTISAVGFGMARFKDMVVPGAKVDLAYEIAIDDWRKAPTAQLKLKDIRVSDR